MGDAITKTYTVEQYIKARGPEIKVNPEANAAFLQAIDALADAAARRAIELTRQTGRTTMWIGEVKAAFQALGGGPGKIEPPVLFAKINELSAEEVAKLANLVTEWLKGK
jgi:hypothetical protein